MRSSSSCSSSICDQVCFNSAFAEIYLYLLLFLPFLSRSKWNCSRIQSQSFWGCRGSWEGACWTRYLSQNWTCAQQKNLSLICSRSKRPEDTGLEIRHVSKVAQTSIRLALLFQDWTHVWGKIALTVNTYSKQWTMTLWLMCWLIQSHFETWNLVTCWQAANAVEMCLYFPLIMVGGS